MGIPRIGDGYQRSDGVFVHAPSLILLPSAAYALGQTIGETFEVGDRRTVALTLETTAKSGTNPTLDVTLQTSFDGINWRSVPAVEPAATPVSSFKQQTDVGFAMSAVTAAGTTPPTITLTGTPVKPINLRVKCTTLGARATAVISYSIDGGGTWVDNVLTAATIVVLDNAGVSTGVTLNYANATAAVDNVWTAYSAGYERRVFAGLSRFCRAVARVGGTSTPIMTASCAGEAL